MKILNTKEANDFKIALESLYENIPNKDKEEYETDYSCYTAEELATSIEDDAMHMRDTEREIKKCSIALENINSTYEYIINAEANGQPIVVDYINSSIKHNAILVGAEDYETIYADVTDGTESIIGGILKFIKKIFEVIFTLIGKVISFVASLISKVVSFFFSSTKSSGGGGGTVSSRLDTTISNVKEDIKKDYADADTAGAGFIANNEARIKTHEERILDSLRSLDSFFINSRIDNDGVLDFKLVREYIEDMLTSLSDMYTSLSIGELGKTINHYTDIQFTGTRGASSSRTLSHLVNLLIKKAKYLAEGTKSGNIRAQGIQNYITESEEGEFVLATKFILENMDSIYNLIQSSVPNAGNIKDEKIELVKQQYPNAFIMGYNVTDLYFINTFDRVYINKMYADLNKLIAAIDDPQVEYDLDTMVDNLVQFVYAMVKMGNIRISKIAITELVTVNEKDAYINNITAIGSSDYEQELLEFGKIYMLWDDFEKRVTSNLNPFKRQLKKNNDLLKVMKKELDKDYNEIVNLTKKNEHIGSIVTTLSQVLQQVVDNTTNNYKLTSEIFTRTLLEVTRSKTESLVISMSEILTSRNIVD